MASTHPEISVIVCSKTGKPAEAFFSTLRDTIGVEHETIIIDNSDNRHSIFSAYDEGASRAQGAVLCFVHEDVEFCTPDWGKYITAFFLDTPACGIAGVAGGDVINSVPTDWYELHPTINLIQCYDDRHCEHVQTNLSSQPHATLWLDGVFLAMRSERYGAGENKIKFDPTHQGFHAYDLDISLQSLLAGYENFVLPNLLLKHLSAGTYDARYYKAVASMLEQYVDALPLFHPRVSGAEKARIRKRRTKRFRRMLKVLVRNRCTSQEIITLSKPILQREKLHWLRHTLPLRIFFIKWTSTLRNKMK